LYIISIDSESVERLFKVTVNHTR